MASLGSVILALVKPVIGRAFLAAGASVVAVTGGSAAIGQLKRSIVDTLSSGDLATLQLIGLAGGWRALGILFGACTFCVAFYSATQASKIIFK